MAVHVEPLERARARISVTPEAGSARYPIVGGHGPHRVSGPADADRLTVALLLPGLGVAHRRETAPTR